MTLRLFLSAGREQKKGRMESYRMAIGKMMREVDAKKWKGWRPRPGLYCLAQHTPVISTGQDVHLSRPRPRPRLHSSSAH